MNLLFAFSFLFILPLYFIFTPILVARTDVQETRPPLHATLFARNDQVSLCREDEDLYDSKAAPAPRLVSGTRSSIDRPSITLSDVRGRSERNELRFLGFVVRGIHADFDLLGLQSRLARTSAST
jgi:hypothetical protein